MSDSGVLGTNGIVGASNQPLFSSDFLPLTEQSVMDWYKYHHLFRC